MAEFRSVEIFMGKRTAAEAADDLMAIADAVWAMDITKLPSRLSFGERGCDIELQVVATEGDVES